MPLKLGNKGETVGFATSTWHHYGAVLNQQEKDDKKYGISLLPAYALNDDEEQYHFRIPGVIDPKDCMVTFGDRIYHKSKVFKTYVIQTKLYCEYLKQQLEATGRYRFYSKVLKTKEDIFALS